MGTFSWSRDTLAYARLLRAHPVFQLFASWPVEPRALGLLLAGGDFDHAPDTRESYCSKRSYGLLRTRRGSFSGPRPDLRRLRTGAAAKPATVAMTIGPSSVPTRVVGRCVMTAPAATAATMRNPTTQPSEMQRTGDLFFFAWCALFFLWSGLCL